MRYFLSLLFVVILSLSAQAQPLAWFNAVQGQEGGGSAAATYTGFKILIPHNQWVAINEINMTDQDDNEFFVALTALSEPVTTFAGVSAGEFATNSTYGDSNTRAFLNNGQPDITNPAAPPGGTEWSTTNSGGIEIYVKPSVAKSLKYVDICLNKNFGDPITGGDVVIKDQSDGTITAAISPTDINDIHQTTNNGNKNWYRWGF